MKICVISIKKVKNMYSFEAARNPKEIKIYLDMCHDSDKRRYFCNGHFCKYCNISIHIKKGWYLYQKRLIRCGHHVIFMRWKEYKKSYWWFISLRNINNSQMLEMSKNIEMTKAMLMEVFNRYIDLEIEKNKKKSCLRDCRT